MKSRFHLMRIHWFPGFAVIMFLLAGCAVAQQANGVTIQGDTFRISFNTPELMCRATLVVDAGISGLGPSHWNSPDGSRPAAANKQTLLMNGYAIYTPLHFSSMHIHVDHRRAQTREFATVGGQVGPDSFDDGYPQLVPQNNYLLVFVEGINAQAQANWETVMIVTDAFPIDSQGIVTLQPAHTEEGQGGQTENFPAVTMSLSQIAQQLASCK